MINRIKLFTYKVFGFAVILFSVYLVLVSGNNYFSESNTGDLITGQVPRLPSDMRRTETGTIYTTQEFFEMSKYDEILTTACNNYNTESKECFYLLKGIMSITSRGDPNYETPTHKGLIPLPNLIIGEEAYKNYFSNLDINQLFIPERNIPAGVKYVMDIYERFGQDVRMTIIDYFAGREISSQLMLLLASVSPNEFKDGVISDDDFISYLDEAYLAKKIEDYNSDLDLVINSFNSFLIAYEDLSSRPVRATLANDLLYDMGVYVIRPSFSTDVIYDIRDYEKLEREIDNLLEYSNQRNISPDFQAFRSMLKDNGFLDENPEARESNKMIYYDGFRWVDGYCDSSVENLFKFVETFFGCLESKFDCNCDLSSSGLTSTDFVTIIESASADENFISVEFRYSKSDAEPYKIFSYKTNSFVFFERDGYSDVDASKYIFSINKDDLTENGVAINGLIEINISPISKKVVTHKLKKGESSDFPKCTVQKVYQRFCVSKPDSLLFKQTPYGLGYEPVRYNFVTKLGNRTILIDGSSWYKSQLNSNSLGNCGPTNVAMATYWSTGRDISVDGVRSIIGPTGSVIEYNGEYVKDGATSFNQLSSALSELEVKYNRISSPDLTHIMSSISSGNLVIVGLTMSNISIVKGDWRTNRIGRHHAYKGGHYITLYGVTSIDGKDYFIVKDPLSATNQKYDDGTYAGDGRYYAVDEVLAGIGSRGEYIEITRDGYSSSLDESDSSIIA